MFEQVGNALVFNVFYSASGVGKTGLSDVTVDVYKNGSLIVTGASAGSVGGGLYTYTLTSGNVDVEGEYVAIFKTADLSVGQRHIPVEMSVGRGGVENLDAPVSGVLESPVPGAYAAGTAGYKLGLITTDGITITSPVADDGTTLNLVRGDDYLAAQSRAISFTSSAWPNLDGATVRMTIRRRREGFGTGSDPVLIELSDVYASRVVGAGSQTVVFELTAANSVALLPGTGTGKYDVEARLPLVALSASPSPSPSVGDPEGTVITLVVGVVNVTEDQTR